MVGAWSIMHAITFALLVLVRLSPTVRSEESETDNIDRSDIDVMIAAAEGLLLPAAEGPSAFPSRGRAAAGQKEAAAEWMATLNASGLWPDIDYGNCTHGPDYGFCGDNWRAAEHIYVRVLTMAQVFRSPGALANSPELASQASLALQGWLTAATHNVNWWWPDIGSAIPLGQIVLLLRNHLEPGVKQAALQHLADPSHDEGASHTNGDVCLRNTDGANALWECWAASYLWLVEANSTALHLMFDHVWAQIQINGGSDSSSSDGRVGIKPDGSFWHHGSQLQLTHYGQDFATASMYFSTITDKTAGYRIPQTSYDAFSRLVLDAQQWATIFTPMPPVSMPGNGSGSGSMWDASSLSRAITYPNGSRCWPQVEGAWPAQGSGDNCFHPSLLNGVGGKRGTEYSNFAKQLSGRADAEALAGHKTFWLSSYAVHREQIKTSTPVAAATDAGADSGAGAAGAAVWVSSVKGFDHSLFNGEDVNDAGSQSFFLSWGASFNYLTGFEYLNVFPLYDWRHVPGTTVELLPGATRNLSKLTCNSKSSSQPSLCPKYRGSSHFVGGVSADRQGVFAFDMTPLSYHAKANTSLTAHKSWFWLGDGTLISCVDELSAAHPIMTTLEQAWADNPTLNPSSSAASSTAADDDSTQQTQIHIKPGQNVSGTEFRNGGFIYRSLESSGENGGAPQLQGSVARRSANWTTVAMEYGDYPGASGDIFTLSFVHTTDSLTAASADDSEIGNEQDGKPFCYSVSVASVVAEQRTRAKITRTAAVTSVSMPAQSSVQAVFWSSNGTVALSDVETLHASAPCIVAVTAALPTTAATMVADSDSISDEITDGGNRKRGGHRWEVFVADPSRELETLTLTLTVKPNMAPTGGRTSSEDDARSSASNCSWSVPLPTGGAAGSTVKGALSCTDGSFSM